MIGLCISYAKVKDCKITKTCEAMVFGEYKNQARPTFTIAAKVGPMSRKGKFVALSMSADETMKNNVFISYCAATKFSNAASATWLFKADKLSKPKPIWTEDIELGYSQYEDGWIYCQYSTNATVFFSNRERLVLLKIGYFLMITFGDLDGRIFLLIW